MSTMPMFPCRVAAFAVSKKASENVHVNKAEMCADMPPPDKLDSQSRQPQVISLFESSQREVHSSQGHVKKAV